MYTPALTKKPTLPSASVSQEYSQFASVGLWLIISATGTKAAVPFFTKSWLKVRLVTHEYDSRKSWNVFYALNSGIELAIKLNSSSRSFLVLIALAFRGLPSSLSMSSPDQKSGNSLYDFGNILIQFFQFEFGSFRCSIRQRASSPLMFPDMYRLDQVYWATLWSMIRSFGMNYTTSPLSISEVALIPTKPGANSCRSSLFTSPRRSLSCFSITL